MKKILNNLKVLKSTSSTNEKVELLKEYLKNKWFEKTVQFALDPGKHFNIKTLPKVKNISEKENKKEIFDYLETLSKTLGASDEEKRKLAFLCTNKETREVVSMIIKKKLRCGASAKLINKAKPNTIFICPYQRCSSKTKIKNINYPAYAQEKLDGLFCNCVLEKNKISFLSRTGKEFIFPTNTLKNSIKNVMVKTIPSLNQVLMGEFLVYTDKSLSSICDRKTGNGILNKALKRTITKKESDRIFFTVWDMIPLQIFKEDNKSLSYKKRFSLLSKILHPSKNKNYKTKRLKLVQTDKVYSEQEAYKIFYKRIKNGEEGIVLKDFSAEWKNGTSTKMIKLKAEKICELQIIDWKYGDVGSKYEKCLGAFKCASLDKKITVDISGGLSDNFRGIKCFDDKGNAVPDKGIKKNLNNCIGKIVSVLFSEVITNKKDSSLSLFLPRFDISEGNFFRIDKKVPDTSKYIKNI